MSLLVASTCHHRQRTFLNHTPFLLFDLVISIILTFYSFHIFFFNLSLRVLLLFTQFADDPTYARDPEFLAGRYYRGAKDEVFQQSYLADAAKHGVHPPAIFHLALQASVDHMERNFYAQLDAGEISADQIQGLRATLLKDIVAEYEADIQVNHVSLLINRCSVRMC